MDLKPITATAHELEVELIGENETILNPIKVKLLADDDVEMAEYIFEHPFLSNPSIYIRTKKGEPISALKRSLKALEKEFKDFQKALDAVVPDDLRVPVIQRTD